MTLTGSLTIGNKLFSMQDSEGTVYTKNLGLEDTFYGGSVKEFRKTKYGIFMCVDSAGKVINLYYTEDSLTILGRSLLGEPIFATAKKSVVAKKESVGTVKNSKPKVSPKTGVKTRTRSHKKIVAIIDDPMAAKVTVPEKIEEPEVNPF